MKGQETLFSSKSDEWRTPKDLFDQLNNIFDFHSDLAASDDNYLCDSYYTKEYNSLNTSWNLINGSLWCNPPYSSIKEWVKKADDEAQKGATIIMLIPARTDTRYFHEYIYNKYHYKLLKGRLKFSESKNSAPFPSMIVYFSKWI